MVQQNNQTGKPGVFRWNGTWIEFSSGDTVAVALWRAGIRAIARSRKLHRHLGYSGSFAAGVLARVDGRPNVRLDQTTATAGMVVETQNAWPSVKLDMLGLAQFVPSRMVYGGFEHGDWMPQQGVAYRVAERAMANLAGMARPTDPDIRPEAVIGQRVGLDCLVVGGGPAGIAAANRRAALGDSVALVTRGNTLARSARAMGEVIVPIHEEVRVFTGMEVFGVYRDGKLLVGAPHGHRSGAVVFEPREAVFATGRRSMPPLVKGNHLPGVIDASAAIDLAVLQNVKLGSKVAVVGTGAEAALSEKLRDLKVNVVHVGSVHDLVEIKGRRSVTSIVAGSIIECDSLVHAGPWRTEPSLGFQASADGLFQMQCRPLPNHLSIAGSAAFGDEPIALRGEVHHEALVCPCMDVTAGELFCHIDEGEADPEVLKRLTSCGMGPCQGFPCWENMIALLAARLKRDPGEFARPTHRPPRRSITVAQAAGLAGLVEPDR